MANKPIILQPREPFLDNQGGVSRGWWRFLNSLAENAGSAIAAFFIPSNVIFQGGTVGDQGTLTLQDIPARTLLGNSGGVAAPAGTVAVDSSLSLNNGTLAAASQASLTLTGNPQTVAAVPGPIAIGANLSLINGTLSAASGSSSSDILAYSIEDARIPVASLNNRMNNVETLLTTIQDQRAEIAALRQQIATLTILTFHR